MTFDTPAAASRVKSAKHRMSQSTTNLLIRRRGPLCARISPAAGQRVFVFPYAK